MRWTVAVVVFTRLLVTRAFTATRIDPRGVRASSSRPVLKNPEVSSTSESIEEPWWINHTLEHADLADRTRPDFAILSTKIGDKPLVYLDSAATSQKPNQVVDAISYYYQNQNSNVHRGAHTLSREATTAYENARDAIISFINAPS